MNYLRGEPPVSWAPAQANPLRKHEEYTMPFRLWAPAALLVLAAMLVTLAVVVGR